MNFWDASAVIPLLVTEATSSTRLRQLGDNQGAVVWWATPVESVSALQRLRREQKLTPSGLIKAVNRLRDLEQKWSEIEPTQQVRAQAERLLRIHALRAADALQLAAAIIAADHEPTSLTFLTGDHRLAEAAAKEGFTVA